MTCDRIFDFHTVTGGATTENFDHFVTDALLPYLKAFNGINPCSIVVLDNAIEYTMQVMFKSGRRCMCFGLFSASV